MEVMEDAQGDVECEEDEEEEEGTVEAVTVPKVLLLNQGMRGS